jgi:hypothetical protein
MNLKFLPLAIAVAFFPMISPAQAQDATAQQAPLPLTNWSAWGGTVGVRLEKSNLSGIGITVSKPASSLREDSARLTDGLNVTQAQNIDLFALRQSGSIEFKARRGSFDGFLGGSLQLRGGYTLTLQDGSKISLVDLRLRPSADNSMQLDVVSGDGKVWFYVDKLMYELVNDNRVLAFYTSDMRITPALAQRTGHPEMVNQPAGELEILTQVTRHGDGGTKDALGATSSHWHGDHIDPLDTTSPTYEADLFMQTISIDRRRSENTTGPDGSGRVVFAPTSTLRNNVNNGSLQTTVAGQGALGISTAQYAAWIPWYSKFTSPSAPYNNDQHPFLIWDMYRINADGGIEQIGRSGVKHAFLTLNNGCASGEDFSSHVLGRSCGDTYSSGNNDSNGALGIRSEIIPSSNKWGRCHSMFDPGCVGSNTNSNPPDDGYVRRLVVNEAQISNTVNPGATYLFDSWYLARQDINIYNSMATVTGTPTYSGGNWVFAGQANYKLGSVTDRWVENLPVNTQAQNVEIADPAGHTKVAVRVVDLGNGQWRYHYAVHNLDFSRPVTAGAEPNLEVISNKGYDSFRVAVPVNTALIDNRFSDGDLDSANDWTFSSSGGYLTWTAPAGQSLDWGSLYLFSVTTFSSPDAGTSELQPATAGVPSSYSVSILAPAFSDIIFRHGFE